MAHDKSIRPRIVRGTLVHEVGGVQFAETMESQLKAKHERQEAPIPSFDLDGLHMALADAANGLRKELAQARAESIVYKREAQMWQDQAREAQRELGACRAALASLTPQMDEARRLLDLAEFIDDADYDKAQVIAKGAL